jgi:hypothetical protein
MRLLNFSRAPAHPTLPVLSERLLAVKTTFATSWFNEPQNGLCVMTAKVEKKFDSLMQQVKRGCLSDIPLYYPTRRDENGLQQYRCIRGTSDVEGAIHQKLVSKVQSWNAGPRFSQSALTVMRIFVQARDIEKS